jgi:glycosyltransferase 2 family protein
LNPTLKKIAVLAAKIGVSVAILGYLIFSAFQNPDFVNLLEGWRNWLWWRLAGAVLLVLAAVVLTVCRWQMLARTLGLEFSTREALRVGFLGYAVNLLPLGLVGGDAVKAVFLSRLNPTRRTEAVATVFVDRVIGLIALLILALIGTLLIDVNEIGRADRELQSKLSLLCWVIRGAAFAGIMASAILFVPGFTTSSFWNWLAKIPVLGGIIQKLVSAMHIFRGRADRLLLAMLMSLGVHSLFVAMIYVIGGALLDTQGRPTPQPPLLDHAVFVPLAMAAGTLPQGFLEWLLTVFYEAFSPADTAKKGLMIALVYRAIQVVAAALGMAPFMFLPQATPVVSVREVIDKSLLTKKDATTA